MIFLFSINIKSFGAITATEPTYNNNQYEISSKEELYWFAQMINGEGEITNPEDRTTDAKLTQDITINSEDLINQAKAGSTPDGIENWTPIGKEDSTPYTGTFDGNGFSISGIYFNVEEASYMGLFGNVGTGGEIKNLGVKNSYFKAMTNGGGLIGQLKETAKVESSYSKDCTVTGVSDVGGLIGSVYDNSMANSCYSSGCTVTSTATGGNVGGLIGNGYYGSVSESYSIGCTVIGDGNAGGLIGQLGYFYEVDVSKSYSSECTVTGAVNVGGLIGYCKAIVTSCYSSGCTVTGTGYEAKVGGLIGYFPVGSEGTEEVTSSYSSGCTVEGKSGANVGGLIGYGYYGSVVNSYSSGCTVTGDNVGGLIGYGYYGSVANSYSTNTEIKIRGDGLGKGGICGVIEGEPTISNCYYFKTSDLKGIGAKKEYDLMTGYIYTPVPGDETKTIPATVAEFKNGSVRDKLNTGAGSKVFKLNGNLKSGSRRYLLLSWEKPASEVTFKIPVRVKINYDPSNKLENLVSKNFKHEFFRKTGDGSWKKMLEDKQYLYDVSPVSGSIKINPDGSKTQDFIFNYYIYQAKDRNGEEYKFGFNKKYPVNTYLKQDVGGGKKLYIDYGVFGRE